MTRVCRDLILSPSLLEMLEQGCHYQGKFLPSGKSGKVGEHDLAEVTQSLSMISRHTFVKTQWLQVQNFSSLRSGFHAIPIKSLL